MNIKRIARSQSVKIIERRNLIKTMKFASNWLQLSDATVRASIVD